MSKTMKIVIVIGLLIFAAGGILSMVNKNNEKQLENFMKKTYNTNDVKVYPPKSQQDPGILKIGVRMAKKEDIVSFIKNTTEQIKKSDYPNKSGNYYLTVNIKFTDGDYQSYDFYLGSANEIDLSNANYLDSLVTEFSKY